LLLDSAANAEEDGEVADIPDLAGNPEALILQGRTRFAVAQKLVADIKAVFAHCAADEIIRLAGKRRLAAQSSEGVSQMMSAVETFTAAATSFNKAKKIQIEKAEKTSPPVLETLFPETVMKSPILSTGAASNDSLTKSGSKQENGSVDDEREGAVETKGKHRHSHRPSHRKSSS
jgi:hypothetical protein